MQALSYKNIYLKPRYSELTSRSKAKTKVTFGGKEFKIPVMPANMVACIDAERCKWLSENGYFYVMHRFAPKGMSGAKQTHEFVKRATKEEWKTISISVGVQPEDYGLIIELAGGGGNNYAKVDFITIDIAHGHCKMMERMINHIRFAYADEGRPVPFIIAGNVTTEHAVRDLTFWGANAIKVGIGGGGACSTKNKTGFHVPMFTAIKETVAISRVPIIADGGVAENADITKALVAGASMVMAGSIFSACIDSPAENVYSKLNPSEIQFKRYFGSASAKNKGHKKHIEGFEVLLPCNGMTYKEKLTEIKQDLQSSISYAGGKDLEALKYVEFVTV